MKKLLLVFALILFTFTAHSRQMSGQEMYVMDSLARIEALKVIAYNIPLRTENPEQVIPQLELKWRQIIAIGKASGSRKVQRYSFSIALNMMKSMGFDEIADSYKSDLIRYYEDCNSFVNCQDFLRDLSEIAAIWPNEIESILHTKIIPKFQRHAETNGKANPNGVRPSTSLTEQVLIYRAESLKLLTKFFRLSKLHKAESLGKTPFVDNAGRAELLRDIARLESQFASISSVASVPSNIFNLNSSAAIESQITNEMISEVLEIEGWKTTENPILKMAVASSIESVRLTQEGNASMALYLDRTNNPDPSRFLFKLVADVKSGKLSNRVAEALLFRFFQFESKLPFRHEWLRVTKQIVQMPGEHILDASVLGTLDSMVSQTDEMNLQRLKAQGYDQNENLTPGLFIDQYLISNEKRLAKKYRFFGSIHHQLAKLESKQELLGSAVEEYKRYGTPETVEKLESAYDFSLVQWLTIGCLASDERPNNPDQQQAKPVKIPFGNDDKHILKEVCQFSQSGVMGPSDVAYDYVSKMRTQKIMGPVWIEAGVMIASIPLTVASGGLAGAAGASAARGAGVLASRMALKWALKKSTELILTKAISKLAGCLVTAVTFTAAQRAGLSAITLNKIKFYDSKKTFLQNYGRELITGGVIYFFLPITNMAGHFITTKVTKLPAIQTNKTISEIAKLGVPAFSDASFYTLGAYAQRALNNVFSSHPDPLFRGWGDLAHIIGHSLSLSLAFRITLSQHEHAHLHDSGESALALIPGSSH